jgi:hypothetical protein
MANPVVNTVTVIGLPKGVEFTAEFSAFLQELAEKIDCVLEHQNPERAYRTIMKHEPWRFRDVCLPRFRFDTQWEPDIAILQAASEKFPDLTFHLEWVELVNHYYGEVLIRAGEIWERQDNRDRGWLSEWQLWFLYDGATSLLTRALPLTLAQRAEYYLQENIGRVELLLNYLTSGTYQTSPYRKQANAQKERQAIQKLSSLLETMRETYISFDDVLLPTTTTHPSEIEIEVEADSDNPFESQ